LRVYIVGLLVCIEGPQNTLRPFIRRRTRTWQTVDVVMLEGGRRVALLPLSRLEPVIGRAAPVNVITAIGIGLIVIGVVALVYQGITYTTREKVLEVGPVEVSAETRKTIPLPPVLGGLALAGGIVLVVVGTRRS
jgi:hypothetical protein